MSTYRHPTYPDSEKYILIGDIVVEPHGINHDKGLYPYVVTDVGHKLITIQSLVTDTVSTTYPCLIRPATTEEQNKITNKLSPESIKQWKQEMTAKGVSVLWIYDPYNSNKSTCHLIILPNDLTINDFRTADIIRPFIEEEQIEKYTSESLHVDDVNKINQPYIIEKLIWNEPIRIDATPLTTIEKAYLTLDALESEGAAERYETELIEAAFQEMAEKLNMQLPERKLSEDPYDDWDDYY